VGVAAGGATGGAGGATGGAIGGGGPRFLLDLHNPLTQFAFGKVLQGFPFS